MCDMIKISQIAKNNLHIVEDAAQAHVVLLTVKRLVISQCLSLV